MKLVKLSFIIAIAIVIGFGLSTTSYAFHSGGVAECEGCHTMHNSLDGAALAGLDHDGNPVPGYKGNGVGVGNSYLLKGSDQSSTCLNCHQESADTVPTSYHIATKAATLTANGYPTEMTPGGDFGWEKITFTFTDYSNNVITQTGGGHPIVAADYGYGDATDTATAPGGTYSAGKLACSSCHNPHSPYRRLGDDMTTLVTTGAPIMGSGSYLTSSAPTSTLAVGVYRILGGSGYVPKSYAGGPAFTSNPPAALAPGTYNRSEGISDTHVSYGAGMSEWCANCHTSFLENSYVSGATGHKHPAGNSATLTAAIAANYNTYVSSGITGASGQYSSLVPFETGDTTASVLKTKTTKAVTADTNSHVMCLSCHRAHASAFESSTRWQNESELFTIISGGTITYQNGGVKGQGRSAVQTMKGVYDRDASMFGAYSRVLCNKCHAKD